MTALAISQAAKPGVSYGRSFLSLLCEGDTRAGPFLPMHYADDCEVILDTMIVQGSDLRTSVEEIRIWLNFTMKSGAEIGVHTSLEYLSSGRHYL